MNGAGDLDGVLHLSLGEAGMDGDALNGDLDAIGREGLILDMAGCFAVDRIGELCAELFEIDLVDAAADFLIGREEDLDRPMPDIGIVDQELRCRHDLGKSGLVVGAEQRRAIGRDDVVADLVGAAPDCR